MTARNQQYSAQVPQAVIRRDKNDERFTSKIAESR